MTDFKPMLAAKADPDKISYPVLAQPKLDGVRAAIVDGRVLSRTLKPIPNREIQAALADAGLDGLDGEIIVGDPTHPDAYRRTVSFVMAPDKTGEAVREVPAHFFSQQAADLTIALLKVRRDAVEEMVEGPW